MKIEKITPKELDDLIKNNGKVEILDVRAEEKYKEFHLEGSLNLPKNLILNPGDKDDFSALPDNGEWVVTCTTGNSAAKCAEVLNSRGVKAVVLEGGLTAWKKYKGMKEETE